MFIQTEQTPNPATLKFIPGQAVLADDTADFRSAADAAGKSPLAERLFRIDEVSGVFLGADFISVTKNDAAEWPLLKPAILGVIMEHFTAGHAVMAEGETGASEEDFNEEDADVVSQIKELLETRVRPVVAQDGGDIVFHGFQQGVVLLHMRGACGSCPSATMTLKNGIENMLRHYVPEVTEVRAV
ncbi:MAG: NifU family protein [Alphaproteobacteria bacterium]|nr:NifU family protein [Alphaproteobacteria bacterium]MDH5556549.1 NifU family protein [Alphaproteobacteria bacterium]